MPLKWLAFKGEKNPWRYDFYGLITSDRQKTMSEWAGDAVKRFSIVFFPSILREIPVDLDDTLKFTSPQLIAGTSERMTICPYNDNSFITMRAFTS